MTPGDHVSLRPVTRANVRAGCELELADEPGAMLRAICLGERPVGVLLVAVETSTPYRVRFMVAAGHQRAGIGRRAVELLLDELRVAGWKELETSFHPGADGAAGFWVRRGFRESGRELHGDPVAVRAL